MSLTDPAADFVGWVQAGLTLDDDGALDRPTSVASWRSPGPVQRSGRDLVVPYTLQEWADDLFAGRANVRPLTLEIGAGMLDGFVELHAVSDDEVAAYSAEWGLLGLCATHGRGAQHPPIGLARCTATGVEPIDWWRRYSRLAHEILTIAAELDQHQRPTDLRRLFPPHVATTAVDVPTTADPRLARAALGAAVTSSFMMDGGASLSLVWRGGVDDRPTFVIKPVSLLGAIGVQLSLTVARAAGLAFCSNCGRPYAPKRRPAAGRRNYCPDPACSKRAAQRDASRAYARRKRGDDS